MAFIEIRPGEPRLDKRRKNKVRVTFSRFKGNTERIRISIPIEICRYIGIEAGDRVSIFYDASNPRILLIKKGYKGCKGYATSLIRRSKTIALNFSNSFGITTTEDDFKTREVKHDFYDGGLRIFA